MATHIPKVHLSSRMQHVLRSRAIRPSNLTPVAKAPIMPSSFFLSHNSHLSRHQLPSVLGVPIFRRGYGSWRDPYAARFSRGRRVIWTIIGLNATVFGAWIYAEVTRASGLQRTLHHNFILSLKNWREGRVWTLLTSAFSHKDLFHIVFNMMAFNALATVMLWAPGIGPTHLLAVCLGGAIAGSAGFLAHAAMNAPKLGTLYSESYQYGVIRAGLGASGMVMAVGAAAACLIPHAPMQLMMIPISIPLWVTTVGYAAIDTFFLQSEKSPVGHAAHLGGLAFGLMYYAVALRRFGGVSQLMAKGSRYMR